MSFDYIKKVTLKDVSYTKSYTSPQNLNLTYHVETQNNLKLVYLSDLVTRHPDIPQFGENIDSRFNLFAVEHSSKLIQSGNPWIFEVTVKCISGNKLENNYILQVRSNLISEQTAFDAFLQPIFTEYKYPGQDDYTQQAGTVDKVKPSFEVVATGISQLDNPLELIDTWNARVNSQSFCGINAGLLLSNLNFEQFDIFSTKKHYKLQFSFSGNLDGWKPQIFFTDSNGKAPLDLEQGKGIKQVQIYQTMDYNSTFPFTEQTPRI